MADMIREMSRLSPHFLAIDQGGHASRALLFDRAGAVIDFAAVAIETRRLPDGRVEHDAEAMIESVQRSVREVLARADPATPVVAGLATQRSSIACWDRRSGAALAPIISWQDRRGTDWLRQFADDAPRIHALTGLVLSPHYGASKLRWCIDRLPAVRAALETGTLCCGPLSSFILFRLLRERPCRVDPANASRTQLWDCARRDWSPELLALFGIPHAVLPACSSSRDAYGHIETGGAPVPLGVCTGDQSAALFAFGTPQSDTVYVNAGTGAFLQRAIGARRMEPGRLLTSVVWQDGEQIEYVLEGTVNGAGSALAEAGARLGLAGAELDHAVGAALDSAGTPPLFLNGVAGLGSPYWRPDLASRFIGTADAAGQLAAVAESIVFLLAVNLDEMQRAAGPLRRIVLSGGLAALDGLCRRLADLTGLPVERPRIEEATARGLAWLTAGRPDSWMTAAACSRFEPAPNAPLRERHARWTAELNRELSSAGN